MSCLEKVSRDDFIELGGGEREAARRILWERRHWMGSRYIRAKLVRRCLELTSMANDSWGAYWRARLQIKARLTESVWETTYDNVKGRVKRGERWKLGGHTIICGDSREVEVECDALITDPPYNLNIGNRIKHVGEIPSRSIVGDGTMEGVNIALDKIKMKEGGMFAIFYSYKVEQMTNHIMSYPNWNVRDLVIWDKGRMKGNSRPDHGAVFELLIYGIFGRSREEKRRKGKPKSIIRYRAPLKSPDHPTMKPIGLMRELVRRYSKTDEVVYDPFLGSGSTLLACEAEGRRCVGTEYEPAYCEAAIRRWEEMTKRKAELCK